MAELQMYVFDADVVLRWLGIPEDARITDVNQIGNQLVFQVEE